MRLRLLLCLLLGVCSASLYAAQPMAERDLPDALKTWIPWVLYGQEQQRCPFLYNNAASHQCLWPSRLNLALDAKGGRFHQEWQVDSPGWVALPGDATRWPEQVQGNGKPVTVTLRGAAPSLYLSTGRHAINGAFSWDALPEALNLPPASGLVSLAVNGLPVAFPDLDAQGKLWLNRRAAQGVGEERLDITVQRLITDDIPLAVTTRIELNVSGKNREVLLGKALLQDFMPMALNSDLPARVEGDGRVRVQVRPGRWTMELSARHAGPVTALSLADAGTPWAQEEVWVFAARNHLRLVTLEGVTQIDPQQTTLPQPWRGFPAYRLRAGETLRLIEKRRGDPDPAPDQLTLNRTWWLDFAGAGYTVQDQISGSLNRSWRLEMNAPQQLGRVAVDGQDQFITRLSEKDRAGVEVRRGQVAISADSRLEGTARVLPALGWAQDFAQVSGTLNLAPGWRLWHARGVDEISGAWLKLWSLLDIFLVLIIALSFAKLWGWRWGVVALVTLILLYHEAGAPRWVWLNLLGAVALLRVLPPGRAQTALRWYRNLALIALILIALPFMVTQVRQGLFPALERPWQVIAAPAPTLAEAAPDEAKQLAQRAQEMQSPASQEETREKFAAPGSLSGLAPDDDYAGLSSSRRALDEIDPNARVQTGPGLPYWQWHSIALRWSGPVRQEQKMELWLTPPAVNLFLALLRVGLLALLVVCVLDVMRSFQSGAWSKFFGTGVKQTHAVLLILLAGALFTPPPLQAESLPSPELLKELQQRLLPEPECLPECAAIPRLTLEVSPTRLRLRLEVHAAESTAVPLPGNAQHWLAQQVWLEGAPAPGLLRDGAGQLWLHVPKGNHQVLMDGTLPAREIVQLALPLKPHRVQVQSAQGWGVEGLHEDGLADDSLQLTRLAGARPGAGNALEASVLPPFVRIERDLVLGLNWQTETRIVRLTPPGAAVLLQVPLLEGESVVTGGVRVENGKVLVAMAPQQMEARWSGQLEIQDAFTLQAAPEVSWVETWRADVSPVWHVAFAGIPIIHHQDQTGQRLPEWRPWPGETLRIALTRPEGVPGETLTLDKSELRVSPGLRATDATLSLSLRSSRGAQHALTLPRGASLQSVTLNGQSQPIRQEGDKVTLPITPGAQQVQVTWRENRGISAHFVTPRVGVGVNSVNTEIQLAVPGDRWLLFTGGPRLGPAVLFWGVAVVIVLIAFGLGRIQWTPLNTRHWILLGVGLSQTPAPVALIVVGWLLALGWRARWALNDESVSSNNLFNFRQIVLALWTLIALGALFYAVQKGLLGTPDMQITGNGSSGQQLRWYQDRSGAMLPQAWVISAPLMAYRLLMLAWALWLAFALLRWLRWGWECYSQGGLWRRLKLKTPATPASK